TPSNESSDVRPCDPACRRTTPLAVSGLPRAGRHARRSTIALFWFCHCPVLAPARVCRQRATSRRSLRDAATPPPMAPVIDCILRPTPPWSSDPAPLLLAHRFPTVDTTANDHNILKPTHGPEVPGLPSRARSDDWLLPPARSCHNTRRPVSAEPAGSL